MFLRNRSSVSVIVPDPAYSDKILAINQTLLDVLAAVKPGLNQHHWSLLQINYDILLYRVESYSKAGVVPSDPKEVEKFLVRHATLVTQEVETT